MVQIFRMLYSPAYLPPASHSSAVGSMTSVLGSGLDELMRHVPTLRPQCTKALVAAMKEVRTMGRRGRGLYFPQ